MKKNFSNLIYITILLTFLTITTDSVQGIQRDDAKNGRL